MHAASNASTVCLFVLRWGGWPPWVSLLLRTMERNPSIHFLLLGDQRPRARQWPSNIAFFKQSLRQTLARAHSSLGVQLLPVVGYKCEIFYFLQISILLPFIWCNFFKK